jgi:hypothetical protein
MSNSKTWFFTLATAALFTGIASAQPPFTCTANAGVPPLVRVESFTELVGDFVLNCTGGIPTALGAAVPQANFQLFLNTNVTSRLLNGSSTLNEALLMIDEPAAAQQRVCTPGPCSISGTGSGINYASTAGIPNVYQGSLVAANSIAWLGVPIDAPGAAATRIVRFSNVRANANQLGLSGTLVPTQIAMFLSVSGANSIAINNPQQTVGYIQSGLIFNIYSGTSGSPAGVPANLQQCVNNNVGMSTDYTSASYLQGRTLTLSYKENFATAFRPRAMLVSGVPISQNVPGNYYNTESGFYNTAWTGATAYTGPANVPANLTAAGLADSGTKLMARFNNVPAGVILYVTTAQAAGSSAGATAALINSDANGGSGALPASAVAPTSAADGGLAPVYLSGGSGVAVWEVSSSSPVALDELRFGVAVAYTSNPGLNLPGAGASTINGALAPLSFGAGALSGPVPRFADMSVAAASFTIAVCGANSVQITVNCNPSGRLFTVDGTGYSTPQTFSWTAGSAHTIATASPQAGTFGTQYVWTSWSDGGAMSHSVTTPGSATSYTATFNTQYLLTTAAGIGGTISPASGYYNAAQVVVVSAGTGVGYRFAGFSGDLSGVTSPQTLTMIGPKSVAASFLPNPGLDVNGDGKSDILWQHPITGELWVWYMNGTAPLVGAAINGATDWRVPGAADFNGDGKPDILWQNPATGDLWVWYMNGATQTGAAALGGATTWRVVGTGDFNGDGKPDILWQNPSSGDLWVWYMNGATQIGAASLSGATTWRVVGAADVNGDGKPDILWQEPTSGDLWVWYMNGAAQTGAAALGGATAWRVAGTGDFNRDGKPDILWQLPATGDLWTWFMNGPVQTGAAAVGGATAWTAIGAR